LGGTTTVCGAGGGGLLLLKLTQPASAKGSNKVSVQRIIMQCILPEIVLQNHR
jgi:hypothetical protein